MALDLEEQEQLAELKAWWRQHGTLLVSVLLAVAIGFAGWQGWQWYQRGQSTQAGTLYDGRAADRALLLRSKRPAKRQGAAAMGCGAFTFG
jgi:predicted negative regulator of RcsB-dependent stress response